MTCAVVAIAELLLHETTVGGATADANFTCSSKNGVGLEGERWDLDRLSNHSEYVDLRAEHTYSLDLRADGMVNFLFDNTLVRSWHDDSHQYGTLGAGNACAETTISSIVVHQRCPVTVHIRVNGSGFDTRWNIDSLDALTYGPIEARPAGLMVDYAGVEIGDFYHHIELASGTHSFQAYALVMSAGWGGGYWSIHAGWRNDTHGDVIVGPTTVSGRGRSSSFVLTCGATTQANATAAAAVAAAACAQCPVGTFAENDCEATMPLSLSSRVCRRCPAGKYATTKGARDCITCVVGQFSAAGASACGALCAAGSAPDYAKPCLRGCTECNPGYFSDGTAGCLPCAAGLYSESGARPVCAQCAPGRFTPTQATPVCYACTPGQAAPSPGSVTCEDCQAGTYAPSATPTCIPCVAGRYSPQPNAPSVSNCRSCVAGRHSLAGSAFCPYCPRGFYSLGGTEHCTICESGKYNGDMGGDSPASCRLCEGGKYNPLRGREVCPLCERGTFALPGSTGAGRDGGLSGLLTQQGWTKIEAADITTECCFSTNASVVATCCRLNQILSITLPPSGNVSLPPTLSDKAIMALFAVPADDDDRGIAAVGQGDAVLNRTQFDLSIEISAHACSRRSPMPPGCTASSVVVPNVRLWQDQPYKFLTLPAFLQTAQMFQAPAIALPANSSFWLAANSAPATFYVALASGCESCPAGSYTGARGAWVCPACPAGKAAPEDASPECTLCLPGTYTSPVPPPPPSPCAALVLAQDDECHFIVMTSFRLGIGCDSDLAFADTGNGNFAGHTLAEFCPGSCGSCLGWDGLEGAPQHLGPKHCTPCAVGTYGINYGASDPSICLPCRTGEVDHDRNPITPCVPCFVGMYANQTSSQCLSCEPGQADVDHSPGTPCVHCEAGTYAGRVQTRCRACAAGKEDVDNDPRTPCEDCQVGAYSPGGSGRCARCAAGTFDDDAGILDPGTGEDLFSPGTPCHVCGIGQFSSGGTSPCRDCQAGSADSDLDPGTPCAMCFPGFYLPAGATLCLSCAAGQVDSDSDATTPCVASCAAGTFAPEAATKCENCVAGRYDNDRDAATPCAICPFGTCAVVGQASCASCAAVLDGACDVAGVLSVDEIHTALLRSVGGGSGGSAVRLVEVVQVSLTAAPSPYPRPAPPPLLPRAFKNSVPPFTPLLYSCDAGGAA